MKLEFSRQNFRKILKYQISSNSSSYSLVVACGRTDRHHGPNNRILKFLGDEPKKKTRKRYGILKNDTLECKSEVRSVECGEPARKTNAVLLVGINRECGIAGTQKQRGSAPSSALGQHSLCVRSGLRRGAHSSHSEPPRVSRA